MERDREPLSLEDEKWMDCVRVCGGTINFWTKRKMSVTQNTQDFFLRFEGGQCGLRDGGTLGVLFDTRIPIRYRKHIMCSRCDGSNLGNLYVSNAKICVTQRKDPTKRGSLAYRWRKTQLSTTGSTV